MRIPTDTTGLAIAVAAGLLKLSQRIDDIAAEEKATQGELALPEPVVISAPSALKMKQDLEALITRTAGTANPPQGEDRQQLETLLAGSPTQAELLLALERYLPSELVFRVDDPNAITKEFLNSPRGRQWDLRDEDVVRIAFYVGAGKDLRESSLGWRLAMVLVDVAGEMVLENQEFLIKEERARVVVSAVLTRFTDSDLEDTIPHAKSLLRHTLRATLNGALDARDHLDGDIVWLEAVLDALADAREATEAEDDFLLGLVRGKGYRLLVRELLEAGGERLSANDSKVYEKIIADMLKAAGRQVGASQTGFGDFFQDHWTDLARAALRGFHAQGLAILDDQKPILRETLLAVVGALAEETNRDLLSSGTLLAAIEASIAAIAADPSLLDDSEGPSWLRTVVGSLAGVVRDEGLRKIISSQGLELLVRDALRSMGENPELLIREPDLPQKLVGRVLTSLAAAKGRRIDDLATAAVSGALTAITENPSLLGIPYAEVVSDVAKDIATHVKKRKLTNLQAAELLGVTAGAIASNPELFVDTQNALAKQVLDAVLKEAGEDQAKLLAGKAIVLVAQRALTIVSARGKGLIGDGGAEKLRDRLEAVVNAGLKATAAELGKRINRDAAPLVIAELLYRWSLGEVPNLDTGDAGFTATIAELADAAMREAA